MRRIVTGDLAVTDAAGTLDVFAHAQGNPTTYTDSNFTHFNYCAYDAQGNVFVGGTSNSENLIAELPKGSNMLVDITLNKAIDAGSMQWDDSELAIDDLTGNSHGPTMIDRVRVSGSTATIVGTTLLTSRRNGKVESYVQYWIQSGTIVGPGNSNKGTTRILQYWRYPKGGRRTKDLMPGGAIELWGTAVSLAKRVSK
jgi:hypothetical protein